MLLNELKFKSFGDIEVMIDFCNCLVIYLIIFL